jgi:hypothetical protein
MKRNGEHGLSESRYNPLTGTYTTSTDPVRRWAGLQYGAKGQAFFVIVFYQLDSTLRPFIDKDTEGYIPNIANDHTREGHGERVVVRWQTIEKVSHA